MQDEHGSESEILDSSGVFDITSIESRSERWRQVLQLTLGLGGIWLGHEVATWANDPASLNVRVWTLVVIVFGLVQVGRATSRFIVSVSSRQARVFRCWHLTMCAVVLLAVVVGLVTVLLARGPLSHMLSHGAVTGRDIADVGFVIAAGFCLVGAIAAGIAAVAEFRSEHAWRHPSAGSPSG